MARSDENWFGQTNKYNYQDLMIALYEKDIIDLKTAHAKLGGTGVWIDTGRFSKGTRLYNPNGLFDLFGEYSGQKADEVRDLMVGWIYDNYRKVKDWTRMAMQHKDIEFDKWLLNIQKTTTYGDDIALYILSRMFNKHVFVHNSMYGWSTMPYRMEDSYTDIVNKCDLELIFLKCWAFSEVKKIRGPNSTQQGDTGTPTNTDVIPGNVPSANVIPGNVTKKRARPSKTPQKKVTQCTSTRKRPAINYAKLGDGDDNPSPIQKRRRVNLLRGPSKVVLEAHKKCKKMSPLDTSQNKPNLATTSKVPSADGVGTSTGASMGTVMVSASADETKDAIAALLALGSDLPKPDEDVTADNAMLAPINPKTANAASTSKEGSMPTCDAPKPTPPVPMHKRFVTVECKLKRKRRHTRNFGVESVTKALTVNMV